MMTDIQRGDDAFDHAQDWPFDSAQDSPVEGLHQSVANERQGHVVSRHPAGVPACGWYEGRGK
jgi:hypothetical protein